MMEEQAIVVGVNGNQISVTTDRSSSCGHCSAKSGCGSALLGEFFNRNSQELVVESELPLETGDKVVLGLNDDALLRGSFVVYAIPLLAMLLFAVIANQFLFSELVIIASGMVGFALGMTYVKFFSIVAHNAERFRPVVLRRIV